MFSVYSIYSVNVTSFFSLGSSNSRQISSRGLHSITLGKFYFHWKLRVRKEPCNAKCRDWNINESQIFIVQIIFLFPVGFVFSVHEKRWREVNFQFKAWENILHTLYITFPQMGFKLSCNHGNAMEDFCVVLVSFFFFLLIMLDSC